MRHGDAAASGFSANDVRAACDKSTLGAEIMLISGSMLSSWYASSFITFFANTLPSLNQHVGNEKSYSSNVISSLQTFTMKYITRLLKCDACCSP